MLNQAQPDVGTETPREDYPWRPIPLDQHSLHSLMKPTQSFYINPPSCVLAGLDVTAKLPICGLGVPMTVSELDFVWLAVYFDTNLRPIHAAIQKGPRHTRWYEYGGISMGGFPRAIKTVRRDQIGVDIGAIDADGFASPDIMGPEWDYIEHEVNKEVEWLSPYGFLSNNNTNAQANAKDNLVKALRSELTYFMSDPVQVKQFACYQLLGYCTSQPPDDKYPYPNIPLVKEIPGSSNTINFWYRQTCTDHLMLQESNAGGVRCCHLVPSFSPYIEALPHPMLAAKGGGVDQGFSVTVGGVLELVITPTNGLLGTLPSDVVDDNDYTGSERAHGDDITNWEDAPNVRARVPLPGENASPSRQSAGILGAEHSNMWYLKFGHNYTTGGEYEGLWTFLGSGSKSPDPLGRQNHWSLKFDCDTIQFYLSKERCMDSPVYTLHRKPADHLGQPAIGIFYEDQGGAVIDTGWRDTS